MKIRVTDEGVLIPKEMLEGVQEVDVRQEGDRVIVIPLLEEDPIWGLGSNPIHDGPTDGSTEHDRYIYNYDQPE